MKWWKSNKYFYSILGGGIFECWMRLPGGGDFSLHLLLYGRLEPPPLGVFMELPVEGFIAWEEKQICVPKAQRNCPISHFFCITPHSPVLGQFRLIWSHFVSFWALFTLDQWGYFWATRSSWEFLVRWFGMNAKERKRALFCLTPHFLHPTQFGQNCCLIIPPITPIPACFLPPPPPDTLIPALYCVVFTTYPTTWPVTGCLQQDSLLSGIFSPQCPVVLRVAERLSPRGKITVRLGLHLIRDFVGAFEMFMSNALALGGPGCGCSPVVLFLCENHVTLERDANPEVIKVGFIDSLPRGENTFFSLFCSVELGVNNWSWLFCGQSNWF